MKNTFLACAIISVIGAVAKLFLKASGGERAAKILHVILGAVLLATFFNAIYGIEIPLINISDTNSSEYYEHIGEKALENMYISAEEMASAKIKDEISEKFKAEPVFCKAEIDRETLEFKTIEIYFSSSNQFISSYEVKKYISDTYGFSQEVIFCE